MKKVFKIIFILLAFCMIANEALAQNIVGQWKRTAIITTYDNGKTVDGMPELTKTMPCTADILYVFEANGNLTMRVPKGCPIPAVLSTWELSGSILTTSMKGFTNTDQLSLSGNIMTLTHTYGSQDKFVPKGANSLKVVYQKL